MSDLGSGYRLVALEEMRDDVQSALKKLAAATGRVATTKHLRIQPDTWGIFLALLCERYPDDQARQTPEALATFLGLDRVSIEADVPAGMGYLSLGVEGQP